MTAYDYIRAQYLGMEFGPSYHFPQIPYLPPIRTGTALNPIVQQPGVRVYYSGGFLPAGAGQTSMSFPSGILGTIASGLNTFLPTLFQQRPGGGFGQVPAPVPPTQTVPPTHPVIGAAGNSGATMGGGVATRAHMARYAPAGTRGYHPPKHPGRCSMVPAGAWVRNRHRNVANIHALRRAISRLHGFERICRKVVHFVKPHTRGRPVFRRRRKRS